MGELRHRTADTKPTKNNTMLEIAGRTMTGFEENSKSLSQLFSSSPILLLFDRAVLPGRGKKSPAQTGLSDLG